MQLVRVTCIFTGHYNTDLHVAYTDVICETARTLLIKPMPIVKPIQVLPNNHPRYS